MMVNSGFDNNVIMNYLLDEEYEHVVQLAKTAFCFHIE